MVYFEENEVYILQTQICGLFTLKKFTWHTPAKNNREESSCYSHLCKHRDRYYFLGLNRVIKLISEISNITLLSVMEAGSEVRAGH